MVSLRPAEELGSPRSPADAGGGVAGPLTTGSALSRDSLATLVEALPDAVALVDLTGRFRYANEAACELLGRTREDLNGREFWLSVDPEDRPSMIARFNRVLRGAHGRWSATLVRPDGSRRLVEAADMRIELEGESFLGATFRDVTEVRRHEREAAILSQTAAQVALAGTLQETLETLARGVVEATAMHACAIVVLDDDGRNVRMAGVHGIPGGFAEAMRAAYERGAELPKGAASAGRPVYVVTDGRRKLFNLPAAEPLYEILDEVIWDNFVYAPVVFARQVIGVLIGYYPPGQGPKDGELSFIATAANQAAVAMSHARLIDDLRGVALLEERRRLARELHDSVAQTLYAIRLNAHAALSLVEQRPERAARPLETVVRLAETAATEMRALIAALRPDSVETGGLVGALTQQVDAVALRHALAIEAELGEEPDVPLDVKEALFRIAQEALNNSAKHAGASKVSLTLRHEDGRVELVVRDNGVGFDPAADVPGHFGLRSMRERAAAVRGTLSVDSMPGEGASVRVLVKTA